MTIPCLIKGCLGELTVSFNGPLPECENYECSQCGFYWVRNMGGTLEKAAEAWQWGKVEYDKT